MHTSPIGQSHADKLRALRTALQKKDNGARATVVNMLDEVAWLLNLRGSDIEYNPVFFAYAYVSAAAPSVPADGEGKGTALLFVDERQLGDGVKEHLGAEVEVRAYTEFFAFLEGVGKGLKGEVSRIP